MNNIIKIGKNKKENIKRKKQKGTKMKGTFLIYKGTRYITTVENPSKALLLKLKYQHKVNIIPSLATQIKGL